MVYYYVKVVDNGGNLSAQSNTISFLCNNGISEAKIRAGNLNELPKEFALEKNYPNPFNPVTTIRFAIPENSFVTLKIFDILGKETTTLVNSFEEAGYKTVQFDATNLPSGIYIYKLTAGNFVDMKKMVLMK